MKREPESYYDGYNLALENSQSFIKIADLSATQREFGIACSLLVLSAEEAIKACFCLHKYYHPQLLLDKELFHSHTSKHKHIENHLWTFVYLPTRFLRILEQENFKEDSTFCSFLVNFLRKEESDYIEPGDFKSEEIREWNQNANKIKNDGFYVGLHHQTGLWHNPRSLTQNEFEIQRRFACKMSELAEKFDEIHRLWETQNS